MQELRNTARAGGVAILVALALIGLCTVGAFAAKGSDPSPRVCFSAKKWDAPDHLRPCARVTSVYEDGSVEVKVTDADGTVRYRGQVGALDR